MAKRQSSAGKPITGKEAEIVLPDGDPPEPVVGDVIDGTEDEITDDDNDEHDEDADFDGDEFEDTDDRVEAVAGDFEDSEDDDDDHVESEQNASSVESDDLSPAVAAAVRAVKNATASKKVGADMPKAPKAEKSKAEMIRDEIAKRQARGEDPIRPRDIVAALEARGVTVHAPQVSVALRNATGGKPSKRPAKAEAATDEKRALNKTRGTEPPKKTPVAPAADGAPNYADLEAVSDFVLAHGGVERVRSLLSVVERLEKRFRD